MTSYSFTLPLPISINRLHRVGKYGQLYKTKEGKQYHQDVAWHCRAAGVEIINGPIAITYIVYRPRKAGDLNNYEKLLFDALEGFAYNNDSQIIEQHGYRRDDKTNPRVEVRVEPADETNEVTIF